MLINARKFDIRVLSFIDELGQLYMYKQFYLRMSSEKYNIDASSKTTHITNGAVQMSSENYGTYEIGNQLPFDSLLAYLQQTYVKEFADFDTGVIV